MPSGSTETAETPQAAPSGGAARRPRAAGAASSTRKELVREKMLEKAAELFATRGFVRTSINDIADSLALKRSSVYHYFPNKEAMLRELFVDEYEHRLAEIQSIASKPGLTSHQRLTLVIEGAIAQRLRSGGRFLVFDRVEAEVPEELRRGYNRARRQILDLYTGILEAGVASGEFRGVDPQMTAFALIGMANWTALWYSPRGKMKPADIARELTGLLVYGISRNDSAPDAAGLEAAVASMQRELDRLRELIPPAGRSR